MREVEFRAKDFFGNWQYGSLVKYQIIADNKLIDRYGILYQDKNDWSNFNKECSVWEDTIGQYTGLKDKNGTKIYEGDIFGEEQAINVVVFKNGAFRFKTYGWGLADNELIYDSNLENDEIIGNIYDNPELIERF